ncbi:CoA-binding protein [Kineothrix sp. MB12-C1]|uniref:CoA-binding protein n=1 Tax=Kineothrix sp. MB12-C1 TaxID=3070215 RepID=UPI0027D23B6F|nr:CoA-binding protein [Kineothrix sp. MB12-C1]WMC93347.1 CoA-binding protein [Kineothrix sp. MB12-C1]
MDLKEIMQENIFVVIGDTTNKEKYACKIKEGLIEHGYKVYAVGKELSSINEIPEDIDIVDLCINPIRGLELMKESKKQCKCVVIQPGAESEALLEYLEQNRIPYIQGCLLVGLRLYTKAE